MSGLQYAFVKRIYGDHNDSARVKRAVAALLAAMPADGVGLNVGAGQVRLDPRIRNMEIESGPEIDYVGSAEDIPLPDASVDLVICQEVLEHVAHPRRAMAEFFRILKADGRLYLQLPFVIGYHPCPRDYWRFTMEGMEQLAAEAGFTVLQCEESVGSATGHYRIAVEFFAILCSSLAGFLYKPWKACFALLFYPVKWLDPLLARSREGRRISGGYFVVCAKGNEHR